MNDEQVIDLITNTLASSQERLQVSSYELAFWRWHATRVVEALREAGVFGPKQQSMRDAVDADRYVVIERADWDRFNPDQDTERDLPHVEDVPAAHVPPKVSYPRIRPGHV